MGKTSNRAWNVLRMALLWGRKGGVFRRRLLMELRVVPKFLKSQLGHGALRRDQIHYGERQMSFDKTPIIHVKMHRPASLRFTFPCINPPVDFDYDFDNDDCDRDCDCDAYSYDNGRSILNDREEECGYEDCDEEIDVKAEEFIAKFYQQMKLQRQISYLQYKETQNIATC